MKDQEKIIKEIEKIKNDFLKKLDDLRLDYKKRVQKVLDKNQTRKIRQSLK